MTVVQTARLCCMIMKLHSKREEYIPLYASLLIDTSSHQTQNPPRVLRVVSTIDTSTTLFGRSYPVPFALAPSAMQKLAGGEGEMGVARAAAKLRVNLTLSSQSTTSLEDVMSCKKNSSSGSDPAFWMQLYLTKDPEKSVPLIKRAEGIENSYCSICSENFIDNGISSCWLRSLGINSRHARPRKPAQRAKSPSRFTSRSPSRKHRARISLPSN